MIEIAGIGPGPHAATILADLGADVVRVERPGGVLSAGDRSTDLLSRGRPSVGLDLRHPRGVEALLRLVGSADILIEGMRPGVAERLGFGPEACHERNPRLVFGRITGWGQDGPLAPTAGHDLDYIAVAGVLHPLGQTADRPQFPLNVLGDFGGGSTYLVIGVLAALLEARVSGRGQVVDAAIVDGAAHLNTMWASMVASGFARETRGVNLLDGGAPFYDVYETADGKHMALAALEPAFYETFVGLFGADDLPDRNDPANWVELRRRLAKRFAELTQAEWTDVFSGSDACCAPVLPLTEAAAHPHLQSRATYVVRDGIVQPAPAPRFSATPASLGTGPSVPGAGTRETLRSWGIHDVESLIAEGAAWEPAPEGSSDGSG